MVLCFVKQREDFTLLIAHLKPGEKINEISDAAQFKF
jgi:hypothetical protein